MKLKNYIPTFRNLLLQEIKEEKIGGIYTPYSLPEDMKSYKVILTGRDCIEIKEGDEVRVMRGIVPAPVAFSDVPRGAEQYFELTEHQITGYNR